MAETQVGTRVLRPCARTRRRCQLTRALAVDEESERLHGHQRVEAAKEFEDNVLALVLAGYQGLVFIATLLMSQSMREDRTPRAHSSVESADILLQTLG